MSPRPTDPGHRAPRWRLALARLVAYGLPVAVLCVAYLDANLWPATGWRLFSGIRQDTVPTWVVEVEEEPGTWSPFDPGRQGGARTSWRHQLDRAIDDPPRQLELCRQWLDEARADDADAHAVRIRRARLEIPRDDGPAEVRSARTVRSC